MDLALVVTPDPLAILDTGLYLEQQTEEWDNAMKARVQFSWEEWRSKNRHLSRDRQDAVIRSEHEKVGDLHRRLMVLACEQTSRKANSAPFTNWAVEAGPGNLRFGKGWERRAVGLGFVPGWIEVSRWVGQEISTHLQQELDRLIAEFPALAKAVPNRSINSLLKHHDLQLALEDKEAIRKTSVISACRVVSRGDRFHRGMRSMGRILSQQSDPEKAKALVIIEAFADLNPGEDRPTVQQLIDDVDAGAEREVRLEMVVEAHDFLEGEKVLSACIVTGA